jgi:hypothetical protein
MGIFLKPEAIRKMQEFEDYKTNAFVLEEQRRGSSVF